MGSFNAMRHQILSMVCLEKPSREYLDLSFMYGIRGGAYEASQWQTNHKAAPTRVMQG